MKVNREATLSFTNTTNALSLRRFLEPIPDHASIRVHTTPKDRPFDAEESRVTAEWVDDLDLGEDE